MRFVHATVWSDYICPWCWLGRDRTRLLIDLGVAVESRPFELHPELPPEGRDVRPGGRLAAVFDRIGAECAELGLPFRAPTRTPNSRRALEVTEVVRTHWPAAYEALDDSFYRAHWVDGVAIDDRSVRGDLIEAAGAPPDEVESLADEGIGSAAVDASREQAAQHGITGTPTWLINDELVIPGAQPRETLRRWIEKLRQREVR